MPWGEWSLPAAAELWRRYAQLTEEFTSRYASHFMVIRYEELLLHPERILTSVMEFLGELFEPGQLSPEIPSEVVLPRSMAWKGKALEPIDAGSARRRRLEARAEDLEFLERMLADDLRRCGY
jgi:hypothetical protein